MRRALRQVLEAYFAMSQLTLVASFVLLAGFTGCTKIPTDGPDAQGYRWEQDGPTGTPSIHRGVDVFLNCGAEAGALSCSRIENGVCDIYLPPNAPAWEEPHELRHCDGWRHPDPLRQGFSP